MAKYLQCPLLLNGHPEIMRQQLIDTLNSLILIGTGLLTFTLPLFFLQTTSEFFELNKQMLLISVVGLMLIIWSIKMVIQRKVIVTVSPITLPLVFFLLAYLISTFFSVDQFVSIFGFHGRFAGNLLQVGFSVIAFFAIATNLNSRIGPKLVSHSLVASSAILSLYTIVLAYLIANSAQYSTILAKVPNFLPANNSGNITALVMVAALAAGAGLLLSERSQGVKSYLSLALSIIGIGLAFTGSIVAYIALGVLVAFGLLFANKVKIDDKKVQGGFLAPALISILLFGLLVSIPNSPLAKYKLPSEPTLSVSSSWRIASSAVGIKPIQGIGPGTFAYAFSQFKPVELNLGTLGGARFDRAFNFPLEIMTTTGLLGLLTYLWVIVATLLVIIRYLVRVADKSASTTLYATILTVVALLLAQLVIYPNTIIFGLFIIFVAMMVNQLRSLGANGINDVSLILGAINEGVLKIAEADDPNKLGRKYEILPYIFLLVALPIVILSVYFMGSNYIADVSYKNGINSFNNNKANETLQALAKAINFQPRRDVYHISLSQADMAILRAFLRDPKNSSPSAEVQQDIRNLANQAVNEATKATLASPRNAFTYAYLGDVYKELGGNNIDILRNALNAYVNSSNLDPNNYQLRVVIGDLYLQTNDFTRASDYFQAASSLKPDDPNPVYLMAVAQAREADQKSQSTKPEDKVLGYQLRLVAIKNLQNTIKIIDQVVKDKNTETYKQQVDSVNKEIENQKTKADKEKTEVEKISKGQTQATATPSPTQRAATVTPTPTGAR